MTKLTTTLLASGITLMSVTPTFAEWSENLLANPGAEMGDNSGWNVVNGRFDVTNEYESGNEYIYPHTGVSFFYYDSNYYSLRVEQELDVSKYASAIDAGNAALKMGIWANTYYDRCTCRLTVKFFGDAGFLDAQTTGDVACSDGTWKEKQLTVESIPAGTRTLTYILQGENYPAFDDAYLNISTGPTVVQPHCSPPTSTQVCGAEGCTWSYLPEALTDGDCAYIPIDRFRADDGNLWHNPLRFQPSGVFSHSDGTQYDATQFAPGSYQNAIEGFFQIRHACQASWYNGAKDLGWVPANVVGAIQYCVYPENIQEVVNGLRAVANQLACENNLPECNQ
ncbi:MAG: hypothetical protein KAI83_15000 [Thiomargarita sp.]|nr:hypothetical protein [Thiomargarita sp.]